MYCNSGACEATRGIAAPRPLSSLTILQTKSVFARSLSPDSGGGNATGACEATRGIAAISGNA
jgi:hypothetical protein